MDAESTGMISEAEAQRREDAAVARAETRAQERIEKQTDRLVALAAKLGQVQLQAAISAKAAADAKQREGETRNELGTALEIVNELREELTTAKARITELEAK